MDSRQFLAEFSHITSAPGGVRLIRQMIYNLAITGDLTQQIPDDGDAGSMLREIHNLKTRLIENRAFKRSPRLERQPRSVPDNIELPVSWRWSRLVDIGEISPKNKASDDTLSSFIPMTDVPQHHSGTLKTEQRPWGKIKRGYTHFANGDVIAAKITPSFENGKAAVVTGLTNGIGAGTTELHVVRPLHKFIDPAYVYIFLRSPHFVTIGEGYMTGTAGQKRLPTEYFATRAFPLPPITEQKRIVAKVDELMALCDKLEAQQQEHEALSKRTSRTVFQTLGDANGSSKITDAWSRIEKNTSLLLNDPDGIQSWRNAVLDLAMSGSLLAMDENSTSTGSVLLSQIAQRRVEWTEETEGQEHQEAVRIRKKIQKQIITSPGDDLPKHWSWGSFLQVAQAVVDCHNKTAPYVPDGIHLVRTSDVRNGIMDLRQTKKITENTYAYWARRLPPMPGDLIFTREAPMGEVAIVPEDERVCLGQRTMLIRLFPDLFNRKFLLYAIYSPSFQKRMMESAVGMGVKHLRVGGVEDLVVPVPPRSEQDKIVAVIDDLFATCSKLEIQLQSKHQTAINLAKASVEMVTGTRVEEQKIMQTPKTELVSTLRIGIEPSSRNDSSLVTILINNNGELPAKALWKASTLDDIDAFYRQLRTEIAKGWIVQPEVAHMIESEAS